MQVYAWTEFQLLIFGIWLLKCCIFLPTNLRDPKKKCRETCCMTLHQENTPTLQTMTQIQYNDIELCNVDYVSSNVKSSQFGAMLYTFEDNEAVIKMIIKGRSPTMRHVSRTHSAARDWLFDRRNLDYQIQIKYVDTKNQFADILTTGNFTRDEGNHLVHLFSTSAFSALLAASKRCRKGCNKEQEENCGKVEADVVLGVADCGKLFYSAEFECIKSSGDTRSTQSARFEFHRKRCGGTYRWRFKPK